MSLTTLRRPQGSDVSSDPERMTNVAIVDHFILLLLTHFTGIPVSVDLMKAVKVIIEKRLS